MKVKELYEKVNDGIIISDIDIQREIIYEPDKQRLVIDSLVKRIPLPAFYFWKNDDGSLEVLDGKQRIEAIKNFYQNDLKYRDLLWKQTDKEVQDDISNTELTIIYCSGDEPLKREIFRRINTLGIPLSDFEVLNGLFNGEYLRGLTSYAKNDKDVLKVLGWATRGKTQYKILQMLMVLKNRGKDRVSINEYVDANQSESFEKDARLIGKHIKFIKDVFDNALALDIYFELSIKYLKDVTIWKEHRAEINKRIRAYLKSDDAKLTNKAKEIEDIIQAIVKGISVDPKRLFTSDQKQELMAKMVQEGKEDGGKYLCAGCGKWFYPDELDMDHKDPWSRGGRTVLSNAQLMCSPCNIKKSNSEKW